MYNHEDFAIIFTFGKKTTKVPKFLPSILEKIKVQENYLPHCNSHDKIWQLKNESLLFITVECSYNWFQICSLLSEVQLIGSPRLLKGQFLPNFYANLAKARQISSIVAKNSILEYPVWF